MKIGGLYVLIDPAACRGRDPVEIERTISASVIVTDNQGLIDRLLPMFSAGTGMAPDEARRVLP